MKAQKPKYHLGDRVLVETYGGVLEAGKYSGQVTSVRVEDGKPIYSVNLDEGCGVGCSESMMTPLEKLVIIKGSIRCV